ncbi:phosphate/phosphite/phosphonate ABC transporter substrate-binding protein [Methyloferula stellata]|uniref:phosphate/phosphite/phosphonate ABC transporter substrate-binding protein n=1 Tax=Methyloferula stellata TaxID=876270 RepID=UPI0003A683B8|nr:PhnD/SsuA/transferrin family substrate-binding protein [Methyloferula stellata]
MYDLPQLKPATDAFWHAIAERLKNAGLTAVPASLTRTDDYQGAWRDPDLLFGQACGYPLVKQFKSAVQIVATPIYGSSGCEGFEHCSFFIVNAKAQHRTLRDVRGSVCAVNSFDSNTGMNLLRAAIAPIAESNDFFRSVVITGSHHKSLEAVAEGRADIAAIDCVSFAHFERFEPELTERVSKIGESVRTAAPPYITARKTDAGILRVLREVLNDVATAPGLELVRSALNIEGFAFETDADYERLLLIEEDAAALGYPELR